jgi:hypothetical protein
MIAPTITDRWLDSHPPAATVCTVEPDRERSPDPVFPGQMVRSLILKSTPEFDLTALTQTIQVPEAAIAAFEQLIQLLRSLHSVDAASQTLDKSAEDWLPYLSDEAYDTLDALRIPAPSSSPYPALLSLETLISQLLWAIARSSYPIMQFLEGVPAQICQLAEIEPVGHVGKLRLMAILEIHSPTFHGCFDLATQRPPTAPLDRRLQIQPEVDFFADFASSPQEIADDIPESGSSLPWADQQLEHISKTLAATNPFLAQFFQGVAIEFLVPEANWQLGELCLKFDFEFLPQLSPERVLQSGQFNWVEAELLDADLDAVFPGPVPFDEFASPMIALLDSPPPAWVATAILRLAENSTQNQYQQAVWHHELNRRLWAIDHSIMMADCSDLDQARSLIQLAQTLAAPKRTVSPINFCFLQPELLFDEVVPKLLWHLTCQSYPIMQLMGGVSGQWMQPHQSWSKGGVRLMAIAKLTVDGQTEAIDITTGRCLSPDEHPDLTGAIVQLDSTLWGESWLPADILLHQVTEHLRSLAPEIGFFLDGIAIDLLNPEQDWQPGTLRLSLTLDFLTHD